MVMDFLKGKYGLQLFAFLLLAFLCLLISQLISFGIIINAFGFTLEEVTQRSFVSGLIESQKGYKPLVILFLSQSIGLFILSSILFNWVTKKSGIHFFEFKKKHFLKFTVLLPFLAFSGVFIVGLLGYVNMQLNLPEYFVEKEKSANETIKFLLSNHGTFRTLTNILLLAVIPAIGEELFFRGVLQKIMISWTKENWIGILITAAIFSAIHFQFLTFLPRFFMGIMLGYLFVWSKNLWIPIMAHFLHNFISIMIGMFYSKEKIGEVETPNFFVVLISILIISGIGYWYYSLSKKAHVS